MKKIILLLIVTAASFIVLFIVKKTYPSGSPNDIVQPVMYVTITEAQNEFGFKILSALSDQDKNSNVFISPLSIELAFSMLLNGADGNTLKELMSALQMNDFTLPEVNGSNKYLADFLEVPFNGIKLSVANSIWPKAGFDVNKNFTAANSTYYKAEITPLDFTSPTAPSVINSWVSNKTNGLINSIITGSIPDNAVMYLINAVYFKGTWTTEFDKKLTQPMDFKLADGSSVKADFMNAKGMFPYYEDSDMQLVKLPYGKDKNMSMILLLPKKSGDFQTILKSLDAKKWLELVESVNTKDGYIKIPKFKIEYETSLISPMTQLGAVDVFIPDKADLSKINADRNLFVSDALHKTYINVNEEGTEAAAVTSVGIGATSVRPFEDIFNFTADHPFIYAIYVEGVKSNLFVGTLFDPSK